MENRKINVDRPQLTAQEVAAGKDFNAVLHNHQLMTKPFYKQTWFYGTAGFASIGLILGGAWLFQDEPGEEIYSYPLLTAAPPESDETRSQLLAFNQDHNESDTHNPDETIQINPLNIERIEENSTPTNTKESIIEEVETDQEISNEAMENEEIVPTEQIADDRAPERNFALDMSPRISNKLGGSITRNELLDNKGITTEGDISVIHFELHLIDGLGGKVFSENGNQLNKEMKDALEDVNAGETIYFENIRGKVKDGQEVRLNPLRYVLMN
ncbi:MAG: hypothetical protein ACPG21_10855 [Crocinitomicaceae bacterium]